MPEIQAATGASDIRMDYLKLLVVQLKNQDPTEPMDNGDMTAQMTSLAQLEQMENQSNRLGTMQASFDMALQSAQFQQASELVGKEITFYSEADENGTAVLRTQVVRELDMSNGQLLLKTDDYTLRVTAVQGIKE
jgi:flagellar basal-body rod modification protein FlgD